MDEEAIKSFEKKMRGLDSQAKAEVDKGLISLREMYKAMREEDRNVLKKWIHQVEPLAHSPVGRMIGRLRVDLSYPVEGGHITVQGVPALAIKRAIEHWERDELYTPSTFDELGMF
jgi:hypothetical protein